MRLLVAEDERDLNRLIVKTLEKAGYGVDACFDGGGGASISWSTRTTTRRFWIS